MSLKRLAPTDQWFALIPDNRTTSAVNVGYDGTLFCTGFYGCFSTETDCSTANEWCNACRRECWTKYQYGCGKPSGYDRCTDATTSLGEECDKASYTCPKGAPCPGCTTYCADYTEVQNSFKG